MREFGTTINFQSRQQNNLSEVAYDASGGGSYIGAALGISDEQLVQNVASRLRNDVRVTPDSISPNFNKHP